MRLPATFIQLAFFFLVEISLSNLVFSFFKPYEFLCYTHFSSTFKRSKITDIVDNPPQHSLHSP